MSFGLAGFKAKFWQAEQPAAVTVWQDGNAADADADAKYDDGWKVGAEGRSTLAMDREYLTIDTLTNSYENGKTLAGKMIGRRAWMNDPAGSMQLGPNDKVEIFATRPTQNTAIATPSWHVNTGTAGVQVRLFVGHIRSVAIGDVGLEFEARDPRWRANTIKLQRSIGDGLTMPKIAFNLPRDHPDYGYCIKLVDSSGSGTLGVGEAKQEENTATLAQILKYLRTSYNAELIAADVLDPTYTGALFVDADLTALTWKPGPIILQDVGFAEGVKRILDEWAPHMRLVVDHQTTQWRLVNYGPAINGQYTTSTSSCVAVVGQPYKSAVSVADVSAFSATPGAAGNRVRIYDRDNYAMNEERSIHSIVGLTLRFNETGIREYAYATTRIFPLDADTLPNVLLSMDWTGNGDVQPQLDLDGVWTAVNLYSVHQTTSSYEQSWNRQDLSAGSLQPGWDTSFESQWNERDADREMDVGADGQGLKPYRIGNDGSHDYFEISYGQSQYANNHVTNEWKDCSLWIWTENGANIRNSKVSFTVLTTTAVADVGDGTPGLRITLLTSVGGILSEVPAFKTISDVSATEDRVCLTQNYGLLTTTKGNNKRWEVGRKFYFTDTTVQFDMSESPHVATCRPIKMWEDNGTEAPRRFLGMGSNLGYPTLNTRPTNAWETLATGGLGATHVWRRSTYTRAPTGGPCAAGGWQPPKLLQVEFETTTTTMRNARFPLSGYSGIAYARYGYEAELSIPVTAWTQDAQTPDYTALALRLFQAFSGGHHRGTVTMPGITANAVWLDLAVRVSLHSTMSSTTWGSQIEGFWGCLTECTIDFQRQAVIFGFDDLDPMSKFAIDVYEKHGVRMGSVVSDQEALRQKMNQLPECVASSMMGERAAGMCGSQVYAPDGKNILVKINAGTKAQHDLGGGAGSAAVDR